MAVDKKKKKSQTKKHLKKMTFFFLKVLTWWNQLTYFSKWIILCCCQVFKIISNYLECDIVSKHKFKIVDESGEALSLELYSRKSKQFKTCINRIKRRDQICGYCTENSICLK